MDTIFALSSGLLPSGVAVIRLSGPQTCHILEKISGAVNTPHIMRFSKFCDQNGELLDHGLSVFFKAPKSFTGEDCAEFHIHGGKAVVQRFLTALSTFDHCRMAQAGEFSRRAFANGKIDLTEAEGLADLIEAETESQRRLAMMGASGKLANLYRSWRRRMIEARALIEAELDFSDEADVPGSVSDQIWIDMGLLSDEIDKHIAAADKAGVLRDGLNIVIAGAPNAGKSSIINMLANRDVAIVSDEAGTTRDILEARIVIAGLPVLIHDTAGLRQTEAAIEKIGIAKAYERLENADLVLLVDDMENPQTVDLTIAVKNIWHIGNKSDVITGDKNRWPIQLSAKTGKGFDVFMQKLEAFCLSFSETISELIPIRQRQRDLLRETVNELKSAIDGQHLDIELRAEHLRRASDSLGRITGDIDIEDILDVIFSQFCIGK